MDKLYIESEDGTLLPLEEVEEELKNRKNKKKIKKDLTNKNDASRPTTSDSN